MPESNQVLFSRTEFLELADRAGFRVSEEDLDELLRRNLLRAWEPRSSRTPQAHFHRLHLFMLARYFDAVRATRHPWRVVAPAVGLPEIAGLARECRDLVGLVAENDKAEDDKEAMKPDSQALASKWAQALRDRAARVNPFGPLLSVTSLLSEDAQAQMRGDGLLCLVFNQLAETFEALGSPEASLPQPKVDESELDEPVLDEPVLDEPVLDEPVLEELELGELELEELELDEPVLEELALDTQELAESASDEPELAEPDHDEPELDELKLEELELDDSQIEEPEIEAPKVDIRETVEQEAVRREDVAHAIAAELSEVSWGDDEVTAFEDVRAQEARLRRIRGAEADEAEESNAETPFEEGSEEPAEEPAEELSEEEGVSVSGLEDIFDEALEDPDFFEASEAFDEALEEEDLVIEKEDEVVELEALLETSEADEADETDSEAAHRELRARTDRLNQLRQTYLAEQKWEELVVLYEDGLDLFVDPTERQRVFLTLALLYEVKLKQTDAAFEQFAQAYEAGGDAQGLTKAFDGMQRLGRQGALQSRWSDFLELELSREELSAGARAELQRHHALVLHELGAGQRAFYTFTAFLADARPDQLDESAFDDLERLAEGVGKEELGDIYADLLGHKLPDEVFEPMALRAARHHVDVGEVGLAMEYYERVLVRFPRHEVAFHSLGQLYEDAARWVPLRALYEARVELSSEGGSNALHSELVRIEKLMSASATSN